MHVDLVLHNGNFITLNARARGADGSTQAPAALTPKEPPTIVKDSQDSRPDPPGSPALPGSPAIPALTEEQVRLLGQANISFFNNSACVLHIGYIDGALHWWCSLLMKHEPYARISRFMKQTSGLHAKKRNFERTVRVWSGPN